MKSLASLALILAAPALAQEPPPGDGPRGSSQPQPGERRIDVVGRADVAEGTAVPALAAGAFVEITALDSGKTVVAATGAPGGADAVTLSREAAAKLGLPGGGTVRVRRAVVSPPEAAELRQGATLSRGDAPASLLAGLRKRLPQAAETARPVPQPAPVKAAAKPAAIKPRSAPATAAPRNGGYWVQVASLSSEANARTLAARLGGSVMPIGKLHRVRIGPLADRAAADRARTRAVSQGYRDAAVVSPDRP